MSLLSSAVMNSIFSGVSVTDLQRAARQRHVDGHTSHWPAAGEIAYAARFSAPAQTVATNADVASEPANDVIKVTAASRQAA